MKVAFGCDHGGFLAKNAVLNYLSSKNIQVIDCGCNSEASVDYPDYAIPVCNLVKDSQADFGILICGTGIGMSICANKVNSIRCAHVTDEFSAEMTRRHNNTNVIALGARISSIEDIVKFVDIFLNTPFDGGRHENRVNKIAKIEKNNA